MVANAIPALVNAAALVVSALLVISVAMTNSLDVRNYIKHKLNGSRVVITIQVVKMAINA